MFILALCSYWPYFQTRPLTVPRNLKPPRLRVRFDASCLQCKDKCEWPSKPIQHLSFDQRAESHFKRALQDVAEVTFGGVADGLWPWVWVVPPAQGCVAFPNRLQIASGVRGLDRQQDDV